MTILRHVPVGFSTIAYSPRLPLWYPQLHETFRSGSGSFPLLPDVAPESAAQPSVPFLHGCFHARYPEVAQPAPDVDLYLLHHDPDISALTAGSQFFQLGLGFLQGLCVRSNVDSILALP